MKARAFKYFRTQSLEDALQAFDRAGGEGCYLAGGQSLVPSLSLRLQAPELLIDISRIESLTGISRSGNVLRVGALTRHAEMLTSPEIARHAPLLRRAAPFVAHPAIRNMGTFGGTIALADPSAEFPAMTLAMDAEFEIASLAGTRTTKADGFFRGLFETGLQPGEILTAINIPCFGNADRCVFDELARRRGDYALVGAGVQGNFAQDLVSTIRIAFLSVGSTPLRARHAEAAITGRALSADAISDAQAALGDDLDPEDNEETSATMRMHLARVLLGRLLGRLSQPDCMRQDEVT
ncbi:xanthine dehydrogenase family protein subunit M [Bradyrhizobium sp. S69]|uniref:FAD binding domain-containing protein n=1 Tax=Bradyrhizobium sp. S69 TaxID=1641856 RepID=UPI00131DA029|nr:xanthine dehydrogenase family protein subunit M [Bradyrhizobium sp. S69]